MNFNTVLALLLASAVGGCHGAGEAPAGADPANAQTALVELAIAHRVILHESLTAYGMVEFQPERTTSVATQLEMIVNRVFVRAGQSVQAGDDLIELRSSATSTLEAKHAQTDANFTQRELQRVELLYTEQLVTNLELDTARQAAVNAAAALQAVRARAGVNPSQVLRAPRAGIVADVSTEPGVLAAPGAILMRLAPGDALRVRAGLEPAALQRVKPGSLVKVFDLQGPSVAASGRITQVAGTLNPQTHLADAIIALDQGGGLLPGATVRCEISVSEGSVSIGIERSAVLYEEERAYVYVVQSKDKDTLKAVRRNVELGAHDGNRVAVIKGLVDGERVVTSGNYELVDGMSVRPR